MKLVLLATVMVVYSSISSIDAQSSCPGTEGMLHNGYWYQFFDCPKTWDEARRSCERDMVVNRGQKVISSDTQKPTLIWLDDDKESEWLENQLNYRYGAKLGIWLGGRRVGTNVRDPFFWEIHDIKHGNKEPSKELVRYTPFADKEPSRRYVNEDCLAVIDNYNWADIECQSYLRYICKVKLSSHDVPGAQGNAPPAGGEGGE
jgi:hypothetical protein